MSRHILLSLTTGIFLASCGGGDKDAANTATPSIETPATKTNDAKSNVEPVATKSTPLEKTAQPTESIAEQTFEKIDIVAKFDERSKIIEALSADIKIMRKKFKQGYEEFEADMKAYARRKLQMTEIDSLPQKIETRQIKHLEDQIPALDFSGSVQNELVDIVRRAGNYNKSVDEIGDLFPITESNDELKPKISDAYGLILKRVGKLSESFSEVEKEIESLREDIFEAKVKELTKAGRITETNLNYRMMFISKAHTVMTKDDEMFGKGLVRSILCQVDTGVVNRQHPVDLTSDEAKKNLSKSQRKMAERFDESYMSYGKTAQDLCLLQKDDELSDEALDTGLNAMAVIYKSVEENFEKF